MAKGVLSSGLSRDVQKIGEVRQTKLNTQSDEVKALPFYNLLPKNHLDLLRLRIYFRKRSLEDFDFRDDFRSMCAKDICFFANMLCTVFEPRGIPRPIPIKLYCDQADCLVWMLECFGIRDMGLEKSRGIGMSWTLAILYVWAWLFIPDSKMAVTTKDESVLDSLDSNTIMGKIVYLIDHLPEWMKTDSSGRPLLKRNLTDHVLTNLSNGATIQGFPPTDQKMRSLRFTSVFYDEFAFFPRDAQASLNASVHTAPNRYFVSTWNGADNVFHQIMRGEESTMLRVLCYWWDNEERWKGAYNTEAGRVKVIDESYKYPPDYPFVTDGLLRSPWVDFELRRAGSRIQSALEELYGLQAEAGRKLFRNDTLKLINETVLPCSFEGVVVRRNNGYVLSKSLDANIKIWGDVGDGRNGPFSAAADISFGSGASYSTLEVFDLTTGRQVLDCADDSINPVSFAQYVVSVMYWLNGDKGDGHTYLTFENNGDQGRTFGQELMRLSYGNIMRRRYANARGNDDMNYIGIRNKDAGMSMMLEMERAIRDGELSILSNDILEEMAKFDRDEETGKPVFPKHTKGHGDRTMAMAMAWAQGRERLTTSTVADPVIGARGEIENLSIKNRSWSDGWRIELMV